MDTRVSAVLRLRVCDSLFAFLRFSLSVSAFAVLRFAFAVLRFAFCVSAIRHLSVVPDVLPGVFFFSARTTDNHNTCGSLSFKGGSGGSTTRARAPKGRNTERRRCFCLFCPRCPGPLLGYPVAMLLIRPWMTNCCLAIACFGTNIRSIRKRSEGIRTRITEL